MEKYAQFYYYNLVMKCSVLTIIDYIKLYDYKNDDEKSDGNANE
jgi:hypothetical protein